MRDFEKPAETAGALASLDTPQNFKFERADWTAFRTVEGLQQKAGVAAGRLRRLVLKELADNALDTGAEVRVAEVGRTYRIEDDGPGIEGTPEDIARLFSIARPLVSTKLLRLPTRGALGNGLRVVAGAVLASDGSLVVTTRNRRIELRPERDGTTTVVRATAVKHPVGTCIEIGFGPAIPNDEDGRPLYWAEVAVLMGAGQAYLGKSSPWWYDVPQFHELLSASGKRPVRDLIATLDGCSGARAGEIVADAGLIRVLCNDVNRAQATRLLLAARADARPVRPRRLGAIGPERFSGRAYATSSGTVSFGEEPEAEIPVVVEAWVRPAESMALTACINRTPVAGSIYATRDKRDIDVFGCGLANTVAQAPRDKHFSIWLNITTPYMPITSDGKEPNLKPFLTEIETAVAKAVRKAHRPSGSDRRSQKIPERATATGQGHRAPVQAGAGARMARSHRGRDRHVDNAQMKLLGANMKQST